MHHGAVGRNERGGDNRPWMLYRYGKEKAGAVHNGQFVETGQDTADTHALRPCSGTRLRHGQMESGHIYGPGRQGTEGIRPEILRNDGLRHTGTSGKNARHT